MKLYYDKPKTLSAAIYGERRGIQMNDYISRQAVIQLALDGKIISTDIEKRVRDFINELPAADVQPVKHGHWIKHATEEETPCYKSFTPIWACSECGIEYSPAICQIIRYCPNCGADMRGGKPNE